MRHIEHSTNHTVFLFATNAPSKIGITVYCGNIYIYIYIYCRLQAHTHTHTHTHTHIYIYIYFISIYRSNLIPIGKYKCWLALTSVYLR